MENLTLSPGPSACVCGMMVNVPLGLSVAPVSEGRGDRNSSLPAGVAVGPAVGGTLAAALVLADGASVDDPAQPPSSTRIETETASWRPACRRGMALISWDTS